MDKGDNLAFHLIQSFKPGEVDAETAHRLGQQFADEALKGKYEYVISTHVDKNHIHNHIIFNAAKFGLVQILRKHSKKVPDSHRWLQDISFCKSQILQHLIHTFNHNRLCIMSI